ncbi:MAG: hypothetical protein LBQ14_02220 [Treponema sp.]|nr:hypothetical protein [Treponema sp.]
MKEKVASLRLMKRYEGMKGNKGSGKAIAATARKLAVVIWHMLSGEAAFEVGKMVDRKLAKKAAGMSGRAALTNDTRKRRHGPVQATRIMPIEVTKTGVAGKKRKKAG